MQVKNYSYFVGEDQVQNRRHSVSDGKNGKAKNGGKSIDARSMASVTDPIATKKAQVRKKAMKIIGDAFAGESKIDDDMTNRREKIRSLTREIGDSTKAISDIEASRAALQDKFGVSSDSQEQKDLELLAKGVETGFSGSDVRLTKEEEEQIAKIKAAGLTEYQQQSLALKKSEESYVNELADARNEIQTENAVIRQTKIERLKSNSMGAAFEQADAVMGAASDEIMGMLIAEGKDHIDEKQEEEKKTAEEAADKKKELEEKLQARKDEKNEQEELTKNIVEAANKQAGGTDSVAQAQQEIKDMMNKLKLVEDDVKGAAVDQGI